MKGKMHELLAIESSIQGQEKVVVEETKKIFKGRPELFTGYHRVLENFNDEDKTITPEEHQEITTTVGERLSYTSESIKKLLDIMLQKESTNQLAVADLSVDGKILAENVPATFLLSLEKKLAEIRNMYSEIPTLTSGISWEKDETIGKGVFKMKFPEEKLKTSQFFEFQILVAATEHHPAQVEKWQTQKPVGKYVKNVWSGMLTSSDKSRYLGNIDRLLSAVKRARQRANATEVVNAQIGDKIMEFINSI